MHIGMSIPLEVMIKEIQEISNDLLSTLSINKEMLRNTIDNYCTEVNEENLKTQCEKVFNVIEAGKKFFTRNISLRKQLLAIKNEIEKKRKDKQDEVEDLKLKNRELEKQLKEKENKVKSLKNSLELYQEKIKDNSIAKKGFLNPTKESLARHNELQVTKSTLKKLNKGIITESNKEKELLIKNKKIKQTNQKLKQILRSVIEKGAGDFSEKTEALLQSIQDEEMKFLLNNSVEVSGRLDQTEIRGGVSIPTREDKAALNASVVFVKNSHKDSNSKKPFIPQLDLSKIKGRPDLRKAEHASLDGKKMT